LDSLKTAPFFSILIPTWNNLPFLKLCIESIHEHSTVPHEIIVHVNEGKDGTLEWVRENQIKHTCTATNEGVCIAMNQMAEVASAQYLLYLNDDMYVLPNWDSCLKNEIESLDHDKFYLSSTSIEANPQSNCMIKGDFGDSPETFNKAGLLEHYMKTSFHDWSGSTWSPCVVSKRLWDKVGGYSEEFSPGMYSDPDFSMKLWQEGVRYFKGIGKSRVYHFGSKSVGRIKKNNGRKQFIRKWGMTPSTFGKYYLRRGEVFEARDAPEPIPFRILAKNAFNACISKLN
jgi:glycosyltransferase involved in cell wall biosynthesis